ncbi:MAG: hypothetical protein O3B75_09780 [Planctomycetota bacterium]|nr:hypothetical protein [Planctomycetota bacterium]
MTQQPIQIRKYPNRRLYDTSRSSFITSEELYALVQSGSQVEVIESNTQVNITNTVLLNLIMSHNPSSLQSMSSDVFHDMIKGTISLDGFGSSFVSHSAPKISS